MDLGLIEKHIYRNCITKSEGYSTQMPSYFNINKAKGHTTDDCVYNALNNKN